MIILASPKQTRYPNQKQITITKEPIGEGDVYLRIRKDVLFNAAQRLKKGGFKLYIYLSSNKEGYILNLSQIALERDFGIKKNQFYGAVEELIEAGYLYQPDPAKNNWTFSEIAKGDPELKNWEAFPKKEENPTFPKKEDVVWKKEETFPKKEEVFPKSVEKDNKRKENKEDRIKSQRELLDEYRRALNW